MITREQAIALYGGSPKALQAALGLRTHSSISMWERGKAIPLVHFLRLRYELHPEAFDADGNYIGPPPPNKEEAA